MKILLINDLKTPHGGAEKVVYDTKKLLEENGHEVEIIGSDLNSETFITFFSRWFSFRYYFETIKKIKEFNPDVVHVHNFSRYISPSPIVAAKKMGKKVILTVHDFHLFCPKTWGIFKDGKPCEKGYNLLCPFYNCYTYKRGLKYIPYHFLKWLKVGLHRLVVRKYVDCFLCPSKSLTNKMKDTFPKKEVIHLPNFIEFSDSKNSHNEEINPKQFLFVGRVSKEKGVDVAIKAIDILVKKYGKKDVIFKIVGDGPEMSNLKQMVKKLNLTKNVVFVGRVNNSEIDKYYHESLAVVMPSVWLENNPMVALEAMKNKKPIIASDVGGYPDLVENDVNGFLFKMGDFEMLSKQLLSIFDKKDKSVKMSEEGFKKLESFSADKYYRKLIDIYSS